MDADALLLDQEVRGREAHLQTGGQRERAKRTVWRQLHVIDLGHRCDPAYLRYAPGVRDVGLGHGDADVEERQEVLSAEEPFPSRDRDRRRLREPGEQVRVLRDDRLLDEEWVEWLQQGRDPPRVGQCEASVEVNSHIPVRPEHLASRRDSLEDGVDLANRTERSHRSGRIHLHGGQSDVELRLDRLGNPAWIIAADPSVHPDPVSDRTSEQLMDRDAQRLALDVPQRLVYAGHGAAQDRTAAVETALGEHLPVILNARGIAADEVLRELVD